MSNESKLRLQMDRGAKAKALLDNQLLQDAFAAVDKQLTDAWEKTDADQAQRREDAWRSKMLLKSVKLVLEKHVISGDIASKELMQVPQASKVQKIARRFAS